MSPVSTLLLLGACVALASATVNFKPCHSTGAAPKGTIHSVTMTPDCDPTMCHLHHNTTTSININFTPTEGGDYIETKLYGILGFLPIPFPLEQPDGCIESTTCPFQANQAMDYKIAVFVSHLYPLVTVVVQVELVNKAGENLVCIVIPAQIVA